jgi:hypothetical protein
MTRGTLPKTLMGMSLVHLAWAVAGAQAPADPSGVSFVAPVQFDTGEAGPAEIERGDFNGDGFDDLAIRTTGNGAEIQLLYGDGHGALLKDPTLGIALASGFGGGDFNGDGRTDVAVVQSGNSVSGSYGLCGDVPGTIVFLGSDGVDPFVFSQCIAGHVGVTLNDVVAGDFTGDGRVDLAVSDDGLWGMRVYRGNGNGTFDPRAYPATGARSLRVHGPLLATDVNRDGRLDVIARLGQPIGSGGGVATFLGNGAGSLAFSSTAAGADIALHAGVLAFTVGDVNGDGASDIVGVEQGRLTAGAPVQNWLFAALGTASGLAYSTSWTAPFPDGAVGSVELGYVNKDGALDLVTAHTAGNAVRIHAGYGNGTFVASATVAAVGLEPKYLCLADWNADAWIDIAVVDLGRNEASSTWVLSQVPGAGDATAPAVALTAPEPGALLEGVVMLAAAASDASGVARVEFLQGHSVIGVDHAPPYTVSWDTTYAPNGPYTLAARAVDNVGNTGTSSGTDVTVANRDIDAPVLTLPADPVAEATSAAGAVVTFIASAVDATDGTVPVACTPASGATFPLGTTTVTCSATDRAGNTGRGSFTVAVRDTTAPVLRLPPYRLAWTTTTAAAARFWAIAVDPVDGLRPGTCWPASGSWFPVGTTRVWCAAGDTSNNWTVGTFTVTVLRWPSSPPA